MRDQPRGTAPDYTLAACVSLGAVAWFALMVVWAVLGFLAALTSAWGMDLGIGRIARARD